MIFYNARIALLEARMSSELANLIRRAGGNNPLCVPAVQEIPLNSTPEVSAFIDRLTDGSIPIVVFFTGAGAKLLLDMAEQLDRQAALLTALRAATVVCRGSKPSSILKRYDIPVAVSAREPYTTTELLEAMAPLDLVGNTVGIVHYGEYNTLASQKLRARGADLVELCLYAWGLPEDTSPLKNLVKDIIAGCIDTVVFTSQIQVRHLFLMAMELGLSAQLAETLNTQTVVASIGPTCTGALQSYGVTPHVIPEHPKMGHLVKALAEYFRKL
jgi:uroporphyrinogen-III synthase